MTGTTTGHPDGFLTFDIIAIKMVIKELFAVIGVKPLNGKR